MNNPKMIKAVFEGDKLIMEVLKGGYNVHPAPPPNSEIKERITKRYERERIKMNNLIQDIQLLETLERQVKNMPKPCKQAGHY